jgi:hypothetical protein
VGVAFVGIPFYTLARYRSMGEAVKSLREAGIVQRIRSVGNDLTDLGDVGCLPYDGTMGGGTSETLKGSWKELAGSKTNFQAE